MSTYRCICSYCVSFQSRRNMYLLWWWDRIKLCITYILCSDTEGRFQSYNTSCMYQGEATSTWVEIICEWNHHQVCVKACLEEQCQGCVHLTIVWSGSEWKQCINEVRKYILKLEAKKPTSYSFSEYSWSMFLSVFPEC